ncbi:MAG: sn-glycerol-3-phosphate transporter substrate-binding protein UgpB, partial [Pseudomonadota bacterium]
AEYKGVAKFYAYLADPQRQATWHQVSGYLPITMAAYDLTKKSGFYDKNPGTDVSVIQMIEKKATPTSRGLRLGNFVQIRAIVDEELEGVWSGKKSGKEALDAAVTRGNVELEKFAKANK